MRPEREPTRTLPRPVPEVEAEREVDFGRVFRTLLRRWWLLAAAVAIGALLGYLLSLGGGGVYQATATIYLGQPLGPGGGSIQSLATNPATVEEIVRSEGLVQEVAAKVGVPAGQLRRGISTRAVTVESRERQTGGIPLVQITVRGPWRTEGARAANLLASAVVDRVSGYADVKIDSLNEQLVAQNRELGSIERRIDALNRAIDEEKGLSELERLTLVNQVGFAEQRRGQLLEQRFQTRQMLTLAAYVERADVVDRAATAKLPARSARSSVVVGALIGLLAGVALALLWGPLVERRRREHHRTPRTDP